MRSILSEELLQHLIAVGQVDVLVGLPTQNHVETAPAVASAVFGAFSGQFVRERTVLLNLDADSTDGTPEAVRSASVESGDILSARYALRTIHRLTVPYHGVPDRGAALRLFFTVAELLGARALVVLDPTAASLTVEDVSRWIRSVLVRQADYVRPALPRAWHDGPLITHLVRPLFRMAYGAELLEPVDTQMACSARFMTDPRLAQVWNLPQAEIGVDAFLSAHALGGQCDLAQVATSARAQVAAERRPRTAEVLRQVVGALFACLAWDYPRWSQDIHPRTIRLEGSPTNPPESAPAFDVASFDETFRAGVDALAPLLSRILDGPCQDRLQAAARSPEVRVDDPLWVETVLCFVAAAVRGDVSPNELARMLEPVYLGRIASFIRGTTTAREGHDKIEALALEFERQRPALLAGLQKRRER